MEHPCELTLCYTNFIAGNGIGNESVFSCFFKFCDGRRVLLRAYFLTAAIADCRVSFLD